MSHSSDNIPPPPNPREILAALGLKPKKSWGQNFLRDQSVLLTIAAAAGVGEGRTVVELGAGLGALTYYLCRSGAQVIAIERDREIVPALRDALSWYPALEIVEADAGKVDWHAMRERVGEPLTVVGNLPYQISSRILVSVADAWPAVERAVLLVQQEVAERLAAPAGGKSYGLLSVLVRRVFDVEKLQRVPPGAFLPAPKVHSTVVRLRAHGRALPAEQDRALVLAARAAFSQRRKTLRNSVAGGLGCDKERVATAIVEAGLDPRVRAEKLSIEGMARLGLALQAAGLFSEDITPET